LPATLPLQHLHHKQHQQHHHEQQCLANGIDASITFLNGFLGTDAADTAGNTDSAVIGIEQQVDGFDLMHELLGVFNDDDLAAAPHGITQKQPFIVPADPVAASLQLGLPQQQQQVQASGFVREQALAAETPADWAAAAAARDACKTQQQQQQQQQHLQHQQQQYPQHHQHHLQHQQQQYLRHKQQQQCPQLASTSANHFAGVPSSGVFAVAAPAASCQPSYQLPAAALAAGASGSSSTSTSTPSLLPTLLPSPFMPSASISSGVATTPVTEEEASSSCFSAIDFLEASRRASAEQARQQRSSTPGQEQQQQLLKPSWSAPHLAAAAVGAGTAGMAAGSGWPGAAAAGNRWQQHMALGNSSVFDAFDLNRANSTPCLSVQQQQQQLAQELLLVQQQQQQQTALQALLQPQALRQSIELELRKSADMRNSTDQQQQQQQLGSMASKVFKPRRPQVAAAPGPDLVICDRVRDRMRWLHQQRHQQQQQERSARRQQRRQRPRQEPEDEN
jgi:hypothetical protein